MNLYSYGDPTNGPYDVFLCHNSWDKPEVKLIAHSLKNRGYNACLDLLELCANPAMTSVTPVCTLADLILYASTRIALIAAWRRTCVPAAVESAGDTAPMTPGA
jgi:hypothetical protein